MADLMPEISQPYQRGDVDSIARNIRLVALATPATGTISAHMAPEDALAVARIIERRNQMRVVEVPLPSVMGGADQAWWVFMLASTAHTPLTHLALHLLRVLGLLP